MAYKSLENLSKDVVNCKKCQLYKSRTKAVPGIGNAKSKILFVGEAPGANEDIKGIPFCGRGGKLLRKSIEKIGIKENEVYITNLVKCRPPDNRRPTQDEIETCKKYLQEEMRLIKPELTILLGKTAISNIHENVLLKENHGKIIEKAGNKYLLTYHPAAILRNPNRINTFLNDLRKIRIIKKQKTTSMKIILKKMKHMIEKTTTDELTTLGEVGKEKDPFKVLISTILSSRTKDEVTLNATKRLFSKYKNAKELLQAPISSIKELIRPVAFYKTKAMKIRQVAKIIYIKNNNKVPDERNQLLKLPLVGRKTANCVLVYGFGKPAIPVDVHVHRISNRLKLVETKTPEETEQELSKITNENYWIQINEYFVRFGQLICKPINPKCNECDFQKICPYRLNNQK